MPGPQLPRQQQGLQGAAAIENDMVQIDRMQGGAADVVADRIHLDGLRRR